LMWAGTRTLFRAHQGGMKALIYPSLSPRIASNVCGHAHAAWKTVDPRVEVVTSPKLYKVTITFVIFFTRTMLHFRTGFQCSNPDLVVRSAIDQTCFSVRREALLNSEVFRESLMDKSFSL
jgi:hypothetical protein